MLGRVGVGALVCADGGCGWSDFEGYAKRRRLLKYFEVAGSGVKEKTEDSG